MANQEVKLEWDGEKIVQKVNVEDIKLSPKDILDSLDHVRGQINQMEEQVKKMENQLKQYESSIKDAKEFEKERADFEERCLELQFNKLKFHVNKISETCKKQAEKDAQEEIDKTPDAFTEDQKRNLRYVKYQRFLATDEKIAEKVSKRIIQKYLFEEPIFENPF